MLYREQLEEVCERLSYYVNYLKALYDGPFFRRDGGRLGGGLDGRLERRKPYEGLERSLRMLEYVKQFYPTREEMQRGAFTFEYDPGDGGYRMA